jgi:hypothetical protein
MEDVHAKVRRLAASAGEGKLPEALGVERRSWLGRTVSHLTGQSTDVDEAVERLEEFIFSGKFSDEDRDSLKALRDVSMDWEMAADQRLSLQFAFDRALRGTLLHTEVPGRLLEHALLTRAANEKANEGWNEKETSEILGYHLRFVQGNDQLSSETQATLSQVGEWLRAVPSRDLMQQLEEQGSLLHPCGPRNHAMQLLIQKRGETYDVILYNTGGGLSRYHHSMEEKFQTYWGFTGVQLQDLNFLQEIDQAPSVDFVYERLLQLGGEEILKADDPKLFMAGQTKGVCAWTMNLALLRHQVMTQPGTVEGNYQQWKLTKALLDREILENHPFASLKGVDIAEARVAKTGGDLLLSEIAADPEQFAEAVRVLGGEEIPEEGRFSYLRELSNRQVDAWMKEYPAEPKFEQPFMPAVLSYQHHRAMLESLKRGVEASFALVTGDPKDSRFLDRYNSLSSFANDTRYSELYETVLQDTAIDAYGRVPYLAIWPFVQFEETYRMAVEEYQTVLKEKGLEMPVAEDTESIAGRFTHLRECTELLAKNWRSELIKEKPSLPTFAAQALVKAPESGQ